MIKAIFTFIFLLSAWPLYSDVPDIKVYEDKKNSAIYVGLPSGDNFIYSTKHFKVDFIWNDSSFKVISPKKYSLGIKNNPWQTKLKDLKMSWKGYKIENNKVYFNYRIENNDANYEVIERISIQQNTIHLNFKLDQKGQSIPLNYRLHNSIHQQVTTNGQKRGRGQVFYLIDGQTDYSIEITKQKSGNLFPLGYELTTLETPKPNMGQFEPTGLDFDAEGGLYVSTRTAGIWKYKDSSWTQFADGMHDVLGVKVRPDGIYAMQKPELTRLVDEDQDGVADFYETKFYQYRFTKNYHEFAYGPIFNKNHDLFFTTNLSTSGFTTSVSDGIQMATPVGYRGWLMKQDKNGNTAPWAHGFRSPAGLGINQHDEIFVTDNQGDWVASSYLIHARKGGFHGHPASRYDLPENGGGQTLNHLNLNEKVKEVPALNETKYREERLPPTVWLPHNEFSNSAGNPEFNLNDNFGPFKGQVFIGDFTKKNILRVNLEKIQGQYQGAVFHFLRPLKCGAINIKFDSNGQLWIAELSRGWSSGTPGIQVLKWDGKTMPYEMKQVLLKADGFDINMTKPIANQQLKPENFDITCFKYNYWKLYGSEPIETSSISTESITVSKNKKNIHLKMPLKEGFVYRIALKNVLSEDGEPLINDIACYTLNHLKEVN